MIAVDLQWALFALLLLLAAVIGLSVVVRRQRPSTPWQHLGLDTAVPTLDSAPFGLLLLNETPAVTYANATAHHLGLADWQDILLADVAALPITPAASHYRVLTLPNDRAVSWWLAPVRGQIVALLTDLSQQRRLEKSAQLFLSGLSHELRTPLTAVLAHLEVLRMTDLPAAARENSLNQIHRETNRISRLVQDLLQLNRLETTAEFRFHPVDLLLLAEEAIADIILVAEDRNMPISLQAPPGLPRVLADADRLKQVFLNLLDNAVKYGRSGDAISVSLTPVANGIEVVIRDEGPGIPADHLPRVGDKLYRVRTDVDGSGLGLSIVAEILRRHHSELNLTSRADAPETGTTAAFTLPTA